MTDNGRRLIGRLNPTQPLLLSISMDNEPERLLFPEDPVRCVIVRQHVYKAASDVLSRRPLPWIGGHTVVT